MHVEDLRGAETFWAVSCVLLRRWQDDLPDEPAHFDDGDDWQRWAAIVEETEDRFSSGNERHPDSLTNEDKVWVLATTSDLADLSAVHAVAWGIGAVLAHTYTPVWRDELRSGPDGPRTTLRPGDLYPVCNTPWKYDGIRYSSKPASLSAPLPDELPHIRMHRTEDGEIVLDLRFDDSLEAIFANLTHVAALIPNEAWDEIDLHSTDGVSFPVGPRDPDEQQRRLLALVTAALEDRVRVSVLPELCRTEPDIDVLHESIFDHELPHLLVTGSHHQIVDGRPENIVVAVVAGHSERLTHAKTTPFTADLGPGAPSKEGIRRRKSLALTVFQGGEFRLALPICKELLDDRMTDALDRLGANVLLAGAMSEKTAPFVGAAHARIAGAQALSVVVNGPRCDSRRSPIEPNVVIGRPTAGDNVSCLVSTRKAPRKLLIPLAADT